MQVVEIFQGIIGTLYMSIEAKVNDNISYWTGYPNFYSRLLHSSTKKDPQRKRKAALKRLMF